VTTVDLGTVASPLGPLHFALHEGRLVALAFDADSCATTVRRLFGPRPRTGRDPVRGELIARMEAYFAGDLAALDAIPVRVAGSPFACAVWRALRDIPPGATESYGHLAARIGRPGAGRAVGRAVGANPVSLVLPCHRVVGYDGALVGYGGRLDRKARLLAHEGVLAADGSRALGVDQGLEGPRHVAPVACEQCPRPLRRRPA